MQVNLAWKLSLVIKNMPYRKDDELIQAGDCAPDAPNLTPIAAEGTVTMTLFDLLKPFAHTAFIVKLLQSPPTDTKPPSPVLTSKDILDALGKYNNNCHHLVDLYLIPPENTPDVGLGRVVEGVIWALVDTQGHAQSVRNRLTFASTFRTTC
jgi:hypothetical protein